MMRPSLQRASSWLGMLAFLLLAPTFSTAQYTTLNFTSTNPADGSVGGAATCVNNGWLRVNTNDCVPVQTPSTLAAISGANLYMIGNPGGAGWTGGVHNYGGTNYVTNISTADWSTPRAMTQFIIWRAGATSLEFGGATIYHEAGTNITFTIEDRSGSPRETVVVPSHTPTAFTMTGTYGFTNIDFYPSSTVNFGVRDFLFMDAPFPVVWSDVTATPLEDAVAIQWSTESESNNHYFAVERSADGENFDEIARVEGAGNTTESRQYQYQDLTANSGQFAYRIRQVDFDGKYSYSPVVEVTLGQTSVRAYPNPVQDVLHIDAGTDWSGSLLTLQGQVVRQIGTHERSIPMSDLPSGMYLLELHNSANQKVTQMISVK